MKGKLLHEKGSYNVRKESKGVRGKLGCEVEVIKRGGQEGVRREGY